MTYALSCLIPDRLAAVGVVSTAVLMPRKEWCPEAPPMPVIAFHGSADRLALYHGGKVWLVPKPIPDIPEWIDLWARRNGCGAPEESVEGIVIRKRYAGCADGADVILNTIDGMGHVWPGGQHFPEWFAGRNSDSIDATEAMWEFFKAHPRKK